MGQLPCGYFYTCEVKIKPKLIEIKCPKCKTENKPIPADMGDKTIQCQKCGKFIHYGHCNQKIEITDRPERVTSSGLVLY